MKKNLADIKGVNPNGFFASTPILTPVGAPLGIPPCLQENKVCPQDNWGLFL